MKKLFSVFSLFFLITAVGCGVNQTVTDSGGDTEMKKPLPTRTFMDELSGTLVSYQGNYVYLKAASGKLYKFDVSQAQLQCKNGMLSGTPVSIIYEGQLSGQDGSTVKTLKVIDQYGTDTELKEQTAYGKLRQITSNTITVVQKDGTEIQFPSIGTPQYFQNGIKSGSWVYIHYLGSLHPETTQKNKTIRPENIKVLSISETDPFMAPQPTPTPTPPADPKQPVPHSITGEIQSVNGNQIQIRPKRTNQLYSFNLRSASTFLYSGLAIGNEVTLDYMGEMKGTDTSAVQVLSIRDRNPASVKDNDFQNHISGEIQAMTANTLTLRLNEGIDVICDIQDAQNSSGLPLEPGTALSLIFNPEKSKETNLYKIISIEKPRRQSV